jgi:ketosteroid isomerase-like protein
MTMTPAEMDELLDRHYAAEMAQDLDVLLETLADDAVHDVAGDPQGALTGGDIAARYKTLFDDLKVTGLTPLRRLHGPDFLVDEVVCQADAVGQPFGIEGGGRPVEFRLLHVMEMGAGKIQNETVWLDVPAVIAQLTGTPA